MHSGDCISMKQECVCKVYCEQFRVGRCLGGIDLPEHLMMSLPKCFVVSTQQENLPKPEDAVRMAGFDLPEGIKIEFGTLKGLREGPEVPHTEVAPPVEGGVVRQFASGANRDTELGKLDYEGFYSPIVMERFAQYMNKNRKLSNGTTRESDNWQKGIPFEAYMKSMYRHFMDVWMEHRGYDTKVGQEEALCALIFNAQGYLFELLQSKFDEEDNDE